MKFLNCLTIVLFFGITALSAQEISDHAIGLRLGDSDGFGAEVSYQKSIGRYNRAEFALGWRDSRNFDAFKLTALYQWIRPIEGGFQWYYGVGGGLGSVDFGSDPDRDDGLFVFAAGDIGIEYNFDIPLLLSLDFRPELGILGYDGFTDSFDFDIGLGIRYQF
ncbi:hypothetical protein [Maribacter sp. 2304DJ31-5]|uniref:hypothetical protein n=1 Tax=Maribacter sp. 2304DJ31-5 TaxID=3386273 RepID=UPI0039BC64EA